MKIQKPVALFFVLINCIYLIVCATRFFYTHDQLIIDYGTSHTTRLAQNSPWKYMPEIIDVIIYVGLLWILSVFHEKLWTRLGVILYMVSNLSSIALIYAHLQTYLYRYPGLYMPLYGVFFITFIYLVVGLFLVRDTRIKLYFRWFAIGLITTLLVTIFSRLLYDDYGIRWVLINNEVIMESCYIITLALFVKVFVLSFKQEDDMEEAV